MTNHDKLTETHDRLVAAVEALTSGEEWRQMLDVARRFHNYSFGNVCLLMAQFPHATHVAGFRTWKQLGRSVRKGERGLAILAPVVTRGRPVDEHDDSDHPELARVLRGFRVVHVFDISQTEGAPLEEVSPVLLEGDAPAALWARLAEQVRSAGFTLERGDCGVAYGTTSHTTNRVVVRLGLPGAQAAKTLAHELAHVLLHRDVVGNESCRGLAEVEAESVAYLVCGAAGLATDDYTFAYVARWATDGVSTVRQSADRVLGCARQIIKAAELVAGDQPSFLEA